MTFKAFDRTVSFAAGSADTKWIEAQLARFAKDELVQARRSGEGAELYLRAVNGRRNVPEEQVRAPGAIVYSFDWVREASAYALAWLKTAAPRRSGRYARSFIVVATGREVQASRIPLGATVTIVNTQPYSRKIQVGSKGFESRRGLFDAAARRLRAQFRGLVSVRVAFVRLSAGYRLKGARRRGRGGAELSYPALEIASETIVAN